MTHNITPMRTPYHALGASGTPVVPEWAQHRSVYRTGGRTLYLVETDALASATPDLETIAHSGWDVRIDRQGDNSSASISLTRKAA